MREGRTTARRGSQVSQRGGQASQAARRACETKQPGSPHSKKRTLFTPAASNQFFPGLRPKYPTQSRFETSTPPPFLVLTHTLQAGEPRSQYPPRPGAPHLPIVGRSGIPRSWPCHEPPGAPCPPAVGRRGIPRNWPCREPAFAFVSGHGFSRAEKIAFTNGL